MIQLYRFIMNGSTRSESQYLLEARRFRPCSVNCNSWREGMAEDELYPTNNYQIMMMSFSLFLEKKMLSVNATERHLFMNKWTYTSNNSLIKGEGKEFDSIQIFLWNCKIYVSVCRLTDMEKRAQRNPVALVMNKAGWIQNPSKNGWVVTFPLK